MSNQSGVDRACADCGIALFDDETWCCSDCCALYAFKDPNGFMTEEGDD